ncbi:uncharacterized protein LOC109861786 [Pseudomyrmex gracilis]|uniref:uncharacterized protein LOC109861786 n=1 Tax=Pseudomyrmex gracilis TaxID=219809 RepID=UPI000994A2CC|nr:uncharacterized protein LOC109861786 [Pseudomyrmex gracilis]
MEEIAKEEYHLATLSGLKDPNSIWKELRRLGLVNTNSSKFTLPFSTNELNKFFSTRLPSFSIVDETYDILEDESYYDDDKLYWRNIDVLDVINALDSNKSNAVVSKALENIVVTQMTEFLEKSNGLDPFQNDYRRGYSTQTALIRVIDDIRLAADKREITVTVFFDFSKAFDYGSVLGPLHFTLYVSDFGNTLRHSKYSYYADDLLIYLHCTPDSIHEAIRRINEDIFYIEEWALRNGLALNSKKTSAVIFGSARFINCLKSGNLPSVIVNNNAIPFMDSVVYLGVTLTSKLLWESHVTYIVLRVNMTLYRLKINKQSIPLTLRIRLVSGLICPIFDYCCSVFSDLTAELDLRLQRAFNSCIRFIFDLRKDEHITPFFNKLMWLKVKARRHYFMCCFLYSIKRTQRPPILYSGLTFRNEESSRHTKASEDMLSIPICRTEIFKQSFRCYSAELWNSLPADIRAITSLDIFKAKLHSHFMKNN